MQYTVIGLTPKGSVTRIEADSLAEAIVQTEALVVEHAGMKRTWTLDRTSNINGTAATLRLRNSKGTIVAAVRVAQAAQVRA